MITDKVKQVIFKKLYNDLKGVEIIPYRKSLYFVDRKNKYWYLEFNRDGTLYWRYEFFESFFSLFSMRFRDYEKVISEWMEEVLNCKVTTTVGTKITTNRGVEEILNHKVNTTIASLSSMTDLMEKVLTNDERGNDYDYPHLNYNDFAPEEF